MKGLLDMTSTIHTSWGEKNMLSVRTCNDLAAINELKTAHSKTVFTGSGPSR